MSDEIKAGERRFDLEMLPPYSVDVWREVGSMDSRLLRVENDIQKVDAKIDRVEERLTARIDAVEEKLTARIDAVEGRLNARIDAVEEKLTARIDEVEEKLTARIDAVEEKLTARIDALDIRIDKCVVAINRMDERMIAMEASHKSDFQHLSDTLKSTRNLMLGLFGSIAATLIAGFILQYYQG